MSLEFVWLLMALVVVGWISFNGIQVREGALRAGREYCKAHGLQLLDQTVERTRSSLSRDERGQWRIWRRYGFEFTSDGERRYAGEIITLGQRVLRVNTDAHRILH